MCKMLLFVYFNHLDMKHLIVFVYCFLCFIVITYYVYNPNCFQKADLCIILIVLLSE